MNITISSDREVDVKVHFRFLDGTNFYTLMWLAGNAPAQYAVVGRCIQELVSLELEYNGMRYAHPIEDDGSGHLKAIQIYGGRDHWSQLLRDKALEGPLGSTTPGDISPYRDSE